jgi:hypothetical protein
MERPDYTDQGDGDLGYDDEGADDYTDPAEEAVQLGRQIVGYQEEQRQREMEAQQAEDAEQWNPLMSD